ncbi:MAG: Transposase IS4 family protein [Candidatus Magnetoglobus multicellularis str. Araruama]|uniref:Transposase IS4 family protein n=1 Tax=Candidatus Magnetoglobus multicellularis str. Araruama TaxID=890399 RepID=A0A1V1NZF9_9BACT|nr:MAG: Transposase IS4 family protein [Candidatus Magnetoglobus multicellularis str. Araruama]
MIQRDIGDLIKRKDGSIKTLQTMREVLFRQGSAKVYLKEDTFEVNF